MDITSTELKARSGYYLRKAIAEPLKISIRGEVTHVLMSVEEYEKLRRAAQSK